MAPNTGDHFSDTAKNPAVPEMQSWTMTAAGIQNAAAVADTEIMITLLAKRTSETARNRNEASRFLPAGRDSVIIAGTRANTASATISGATPPERFSTRQSAWKRNENTTVMAMHAADMMDVIFTGLIYRFSQETHGIAMES